MGSLRRWRRFLLRGSRIEPRVALLKPISSAISIGSGGSVRRRGSHHHDGRRLRLDDRAALHLTAAERKTLLVAGAAAGMSATFASPVAAVLLSVELLLFELKPRSLVPVALAKRGGGRGAPLHPRTGAALPGSGRRHRSRDPRR